MDSSYGSEAESGTGPKHARTPDQTKCRCDVLPHIGGVRRSEVEYIGWISPTGVMWRLAVPEPSSLSSLGELYDRPANVISGREPSTYTLADIHGRGDPISYYIGISLGYPKCCCESFAMGRFAFMVEEELQTMLDEKFPAIGMVPCEQCAEDLIVGKLTPANMYGGRSVTFTNQQLNVLYHEAKRKVAAWPSVEIP